MRIRASGNKGIVFKAFIAFLLTFPLLLACESDELTQVRNTMDQYRSGLDARDRNKVEPLLAREIQIINPSENFTLSRLDFLDRIMRDELLSVRTSFRYRSLKASGNLASIELFEDSTAVLRGGEARHFATYMYALRREGDHWVIFRIERLL